MKRALLFLGLHLVVLNINAQSPEKEEFFYITGEIAFGNYTESNLNVNIILNEKYSLQFGYSGHVRKAKSEPYDFSSGVMGIFSLGLSGLHLDHMKNYQVLFGRVFPLDESGQIRLNLAGGVGYTVITEPTNWRRVTGNSWLGDNYKYDVEKHSTVSLIINPRFEFPLAAAIGITLYPMLQINKDRTFIGFGAGIMLGRLRKKTNLSPESTSLKSPGQDP